MVVGDFPLRDKVAIVTGGGSGINLAFVALAVTSGAKCLIADLKLSPSAEELLKEHPGQIAFRKCDVTSWPDLEALPSAVSSAFGAGTIPDVYIAGAGVFEPKWSSFFYDSETDFYRTMRINAEHPIKLTRIAMRTSLSANKPCVVLIVASTAGVIGVYGSALYCASKHAVVGFVKSMAPADAEENFKVVAILPGMVDTPLWTADEAKDVADQFTFQAKEALTADEVALAMKDLVEQGKYTGGTLLQIQPNSGTTVLPSLPYHGEMPDRLKTILSNSNGAVKQIFDRERRS
jgi:NAD(P)-dependent dehydrogenase (short-subunit alcohol dehydrogenase family)